ncbi:hypothetical protein M231_01973 [Tremella mesenterica]|uniref:Uncharacterized protein n=1 Tax=Tremella mesenterica TaxID=5217 RepID=A0A4Q1BRV2_TREME|nr:hypothetical protein M231_01973 [Tremella mesenterica]
MPGMNIPNVFGQVPSGVFGPDKNVDRNVPSSYSQSSPDDTNTPSMTWDSPLTSSTNEYLQTPFTPSPHETQVPLPPQPSKVPPHSPSLKENNTLLMRGLGIGRPSTPHISETSMELTGQNQRFPTSKRHSRKYSYASTPWNGVLSFGNQTPRNGQEGSSLTSKRSDSSPGKEERRSSDSQLTDRGMMEQKRRSMVWTTPRGSSLPSSRPLEETSELDSFPEIEGQYDFERNHHRSRPDYRHLLKSNTLFPRRSDETIASHQTPASPMSPVGRNTFLSARSFDKWDLKVSKLATGGVPRMNTDKDEEGDTLSHVISTLSLSSYDGDRGGEGSGGTENSQDTATLSGENFWVSEEMYVIGKGRDLEEEPGSPEALEMRAKRRRIRRNTEQSSRVTSTSSSSLKRARRASQVVLQSTNNLPDVEMVESSGMGVASQGEGSARDIRPVFHESETMDMDMDIDMD